MTRDSDVTYGHGKHVIQPARPTSYILQFSSKNGRSETPFSWRSGLDGETPEGLAIRIPVPHGNRYPDGWSGSALAPAGHGYTIDEAYELLRARGRRCKSFAVGRSAGE
jgi:hypothetical protein